MAVRLVVDGLPARFADDALKDLFSPYGTVLSAKVVESVHIPSYRLGIIEMATMEEAERSREALHRTTLEGQLILVFITAS